jgi:ferric-dicitrate binding protein FerR (iron transport regulator)
MPAEAGLECIVLFHQQSSRRRLRPLSALLAFLLLALAPGLLRAQDLAALPAPWIVAESRGPAEVRHDRGAWQPLQAGAVVAAASEIRTGPSAEVLLTRGSDRVRLKGQSYLELPAAAEGAPEDGSMTRLVQWLGEAVFEVEHRPDPHFEVDTPYLTAIVKGTAFIIDVTPDGSAVAVTEGVVAVGTPGGATTVVTAGMTARGYAGLSGFTIEDSSGAAPEPPPPADATHEWPTPDFQPIIRSFPAP